MKKEQLDKMSTREVLEYTRNLLISEGGLSIILERIVSDIEKLQKTKNE